MFTYDFDLLTSPLRTYQLVGGATGCVLLDRMLFVISHNDEEDPCSVSANDMARIGLSYCRVTYMTGATNSQFVVVVVVVVGSLLSI